MDLLFIPRVICEYEEPQWKDIDRGNRRSRRKTRPSAICPPEKKYIYITGLGTNPGLRGERQATNRLHGIA
jgi:hypothetical protein